MVNTGDVKQRTMKSERGNILTVMKHMICITVSSTLATATAAQVFLSYLRGSMPDLIPLTINNTPNIMTWRADRVAIISPGDTG